MRGEDIKLLLDENERVGGFAGGESGAKRGESTEDVVGVLGGSVLSSGLLFPLFEWVSVPSGEDSGEDGHAVDIVVDARDDGQGQKERGCERRLLRPPQM